MERERDELARLGGAPGTLPLVGMRELRHDDVPAGREVGPELGEPRRGVGEPPREELVEEHAEREEVGARVHGLPLPLLGGHVGERPRERQVARAERGREVELGHEGARRLAEAEVHDLGRAVALDEDVLGLQVEVEDPGRVNRREPVEDLVAEEGRRLRADRAAAEAPERLAPHELGREEGDLALGVAGDVGGDVRVLDLREEDPLAAEVPYERGAPRDLER